MPASGLPYRWSQTEAEVTVELDLPTGGCGPVGRRLGGRDVRCLIGAHELRLVLLVQVVHLHHPLATGDEHQPRPRLVVVQEHAT